MGKPTLPEKIYQQMLGDVYDDELIVARFNQLIDYLKAKEEQR